jgi:hypothetical protein
LWIKTAGESSASKLYFYICPSKVFRWSIL